MNTCCDGSHGSPCVSTLPAAHDAAVMFAVATAVTWRDFEPPWNWTPVCATVALPAPVQFAIPPSNVAVSPDRRSARTYPVPPAPPVVLPSATFAPPCAWTVIDPTVNVELPPVPDPLAPPVATC